MMRRNVEKIAQGLLGRMHLSATQAAVLLDQTAEPKTLRVYIFDERAAKQSFDIKKWRGYRVDIVRDAKVEPHRRATG